MRGLYESLTGIYEFVYYGEWKDVNNWSNFTEISVGFLQEFVNVKGPRASERWFLEFKYIFGTLKFIDFCPKLKAI